jgi:hypothetical protein
MSAKITIPRPVVKMRPVQRQRVFLKARDERCTVEMSDRSVIYIFFILFTDNLF